MSAQTRLTTLYQASAEESNKRVEELITAVEELQTLHSKSVEGKQEIRDCSYIRSPENNHKRHM